MKNSTDAGTSCILMTDCAMSRTSAPGTGTVREGSLAACRFMVEGCVTGTVVLAVVTTVAGISLRTPLSSLPLSTGAVYTAPDTGEGEGGAGITDATPKTERPCGEMISK